MCNKLTHQQICSSYSRVYRRPGRNDGRLCHLVDWNMEGPPGVMEGIFIHVFIWLQLYSLKSKSVAPISVVMVSISWEDPLCLCWRFLYYPFIFLSTPLSVGLQQMCHFPHHGWPGSALCDSTRPFNNSFLSLTCFSIFLIAVGGSPAATVQVNHSETPLCLFSFPAELVRWNWNERRLS